METTTPTVYVGYRPRPKDRCPKCDGIDADASVLLRRPVRVSLGAREPEAWTHDIELRCRKMARCGGPVGLLVRTKLSPASSTLWTVIGRPIRPD